MIIEGNKLQRMQEYYESAVIASQSARTDFEKHRAQYRGDTAIDGSNEKAAFCRNVTYEIIESIVSTVIPSARVEAEEFTAENEQLAATVERLCMKERNRIDFERIVDITERDVTVAGVAIYLLEWDNRIRRRGTDGAVCVSAVDPTDFFPQPNRSEIRDMDYCFIRGRTTVRDLTERYSLSREAAEMLSPSADEESRDGETVEVVTAFYYDTEGRLSKFIFSGDVVLEDIPNYYSRKIKTCSNCGKSHEKCTCGKYTPVLTDQYYEEINARELKSIGLEHCKDETVRIPWYTPNSMPIVIRTNITRSDRWYGESDCEFIRPYQQELNKLESRIHAKLMGASVFPVLPIESEFRIDNSINTRVLRLREGENKGAYGVIDTTVDIEQDIANAERVYQMAKRSMGITDSFQGHADATAQSGRAKQIQVDQSAGRMASKRVMKQVAFAEMDRIIFELYLAFSDQPRKLTYVDSMGKRVSDSFSRYDFLRYDESRGEYYYYDDFLFATDTADEMESKREQISDKLVSQFSSGVLGDPHEYSSVLRLWQCLDRLHHPLG